MSVPEPAPAPGRPTAPRRARRPAAPASRGRCSGGASVQPHGQRPDPRADRHDEGHLDHVRSRLRRQHPLHPGPLAAAEERQQPVQVHTAALGQPAAGSAGRPVAGQRLGQQHRELPRPGRPPSAARPAVAQAAPSPALPSTGPVCWHGDRPPGGSRSAATRRAPSWICIVDRSSGVSACSTSVLAR